jgi:hypothetical protein
MFFSNVWVQHLSCNTYCKHALHTFSWGKVHMHYEGLNLMLCAYKYWDTWPWLLDSMAHSYTHPNMDPSACMMTQLENTSLQAMSRRCMTPIFMYHMHNTSSHGIMCGLEVGCLECVVHLGVLWRHASCIMHGVCMGVVWEHQ